VLVTSSPAVNGGLPFHSGEPGRPVRFQDWLSRRRWGGFRPSAGSVLWRCHGRSHPKACHRGRFSTDRSPNRSNLAVLCRHGSHLVGQRPSTGLPARRKHGWSAAHIPRSFAMGCGVTLSKHTFADDLAVSVGFRPCHWRRLRHGTDAIHARRERRDSLAD